MNEHKVTKEQLELLLTEMAVKLEVLVYRNEFSVCHFCGMGKILCDGGTAWKPGKHLSHCLINRAKTLLNLE